MSSSNIRRFVICLPDPMLLRSIILSVNLVSLYSYLSFLLLRSSKLDLGGMIVQPNFLQVPVMSTFFHQRRGKPGGKVVLSKVGLWRIHQTTQDTESLELQVLFIIVVVLDTEEVVKGRCPSASVPSHLHYRTRNRRQPLI
jgi:hypothetical protein